MTTRRASIAIAATVLFTLAQPLAPAAQRRPTIADFLSPAYPFDLVAARNADRIAWLAYDQGRRNVYTAAAPAFAPVRLSSFLDDDGIDISELSISDDGLTVTFVRGSAPNRAGWMANPTSDPDGAERSIWAARLTAGRPAAAWRVAEGANPELAPDGRAVLFVRGGQIFRATLASPHPVSAMDRGESPFIERVGHEWQSALVTRRPADRVREQPRRSRLHRRVRRRRADGALPGAGRRPRHEPHVVG